MNKNIKKTDMILIAVILAAALIGLLCSKILFSAPASTVEVSMIGENSEKIVLETFSLNDTVSFPIETEPLPGGSEPGLNHLIIQDGAVWISEANCPNHDCVRQGKIQQTGEMLVCLPHRITVTINGN